MDVNVELKFLWGGVSSGGRVGGVGGWVRVDVNAM